MNEEEAATRQLFELKTFREEAMPNFDFFKETQCMSEIYAFVSEKMCETLDETLSAGQLRAGKEEVISEEMIGRPRMYLWTRSDKKRTSSEEDEGGKLDIVEESPVKKKRKAAAAKIKR